VYKTENMAELVSYQVALLASYDVVVLNPAQIHGGFLLVHRQTRRANWYAMSVSATDTAQLIRLD
jgi:hypothetical protein